MIQHRHEISPVGPAAEMAARCSATVPTLTTDRLVLRPIRVDDFEVYTDIVCTDRGQYVGGPYTRDDAWFDFIQLASGWMLHGHGGWAIGTESARAGFVILGLEPGDQEPELGFLLPDHAEGQGIAFEAAVVARDFARDTLKLASLVSYIDVDNTRSVRLAKRLDAKRDPQAEMRLNNSCQVWRHWGPVRGTM